jgi:hypothetical protein
MRVLLIDDDQNLGGLVRRRLTAENRVVDWAHRLDDALAGCREFPSDLLPRFHVRCDLQTQKTLAVSVDLGLLGAALQAHPKKQTTRR